MSSPVRLKWPTLIFSELNPLFTGSLGPMTTQTDHQKFAQSQQINKLHWNLINYLQLVYPRARAKIYKSIMYIQRGVTYAYCKYLLYNKTKCKASWRASQWLQGKYFNTDKKGGTSHYFTLSIRWVVEVQCWTLWIIVMDIQLTFHCPPRYFCGCVVHIRL